VRCGANPSQHRLNHCEAQCSEVHEIVLEAAGFLSRPAAFLYPKFPSSQRSKQPLTVPSDPCVLRLIHQRCALSSQGERYVRCHK